jgi:hypothetical protein
MMEFQSEDWRKLFEGVMDNTGTCHTVPLAVTAHLEHYTMDINYWRSDVQSSVHPLASFKDTKMNIPPVSHDKMLRADNFLVI